MSDCRNGARRATLPIVIPPVVMAAGLEELELNSPQWLIKLVFNHPLTGLVPFYVVLAMPFTYRAIDSGVRAIDLHTWSMPRGTSAPHGLTT